MSLTWRRHDLLKPPTDAEMAEMAPEDLIGLFETYHKAIEDAERDPYRYGFRLPQWLDAERLLLGYNEVLVSGGNRCIAAEQEIYDPVAKKYRRVDSIEGPFHVYAWDWGLNRKVVSPAEKPFQKPIDSLFRVELDNRQSFSCSAEHRVLSGSGWCSLQSIGLGGVVVLRESKDKWSASFSGRLLSFCASRLPTSWVSYLSGSRLDALRWMRTVQDFLSDCPSCPRFYDESLRSAATNAQDAFPLPDGALERKEYVFCDEDGRASKSHSSRLYLEDDRLSSRYAVNRFVAHCGAALAQSLHSVLRSPPLNTEPRRDQESPWKSRLVSFREQCGLTVLRCLSWFLEVASSSIILPCESSVVKVYHKRRDVVWDFTVPSTGNYFIGDILQKNSGKTTWAATAVVKAAMENPGGAIMCFSQNADVSIRQQQAAVYDALPEEFKRKVLGAETNISYTRKNGFSKSSLILPNRTHIIFKTYAQFLNDDTILEGAELGSREPTWINIGAWCDEYLKGPELLATLRFRLATRNAKMIVTVTPIDGYTEVVRDYLQGARTEKSKPAELLKGRMVPYIQHSKNRNAGIVYFHSKDNPFGGYDRIAVDLLGRPEEEILCRAYGIPTKSASTLFPLFSRELNVVSHESVPTKDVTRYMILDPAGRKNWFMCWIAVDATDTYYVYREWPDAFVGDWAKWHGGKWIGGQGCKGLGYGIKDYVDLIMRCEDGEQVFERLIDPRLGAAKYQSQNGASSIIEDLADAGLVFAPAPGLEIEDGIQALQTKMAYSPKSPIDGINRPHFYVSERCPNIITALSEYTGADGPDEAWKDPVDVVRYAAIAGVNYIHPDKLKPSKPMGGY